MMFVFLLNLFYVDLFNALTTRTPKEMRKNGERCHGVFLFMDEFADITGISRFDRVCCTVRKYELSISIILQNISQVIANYGHHEANAILEG